MPSELLTASVPDAAARDTCRDVLAWEGPDRVLTLTVDAREASLPDSAALHAIERALEDLEHAEAGRRPAAARIAGELRGDVGAARSHAQAGGFAVVADLVTGRVRRIHLDRPVPTRLVVGPRAAVRPIHRALCEALPAGVARASAHGVEIGEWAPPAIRGIVSFTLPELEERDLRGPAVAHPRGARDAAPSTRSARQTDLFRKRVEVARHALVEQAAARVADEARAREWREIVVAGDHEQVAALVDALPDEARRLVVEATLPGRRRSAALAEAVGAALATARRRRGEELLAEARATALGGGHAVLGVEATIDALAADRVRLLLLPVEAPIAGFVHHDGTLTPLRRGGPVPADADSQLADAMIRAALAAGADVVLVDPLEAGEAAALLRW